MATTYPPPLESSFTLNEVGATFLGPSKSPMLSSMSPNLLADFDLQSCSIPRVNSINKRSMELIAKAVDMDASYANSRMFGDVPFERGYCTEDNVSKPLDAALTQDDGPPSAVQQTPSHRPENDGTFDVTPKQSTERQFFDAVQTYPYPRLSTSDNNLLSTDLPNPLLGGPRSPRARYSNTADSQGQSLLDTPQLTGDLSPSPSRRQNSMGNSFGPRSSINYPNPIAPAPYKPSVPISSANRVMAQQPTYIIPPSTPSPMNPVYSPGPPRVEEVCVECAMRDQDMADVDVTGPGVWDRESDVDYHNLVQKEAEEEAQRLARPSSPLTFLSDPKRPRAHGGRLTEQNLKIWLTMNPREPQSRQQAIEVYVKTQIALLEAEALARARAMLESRALESKMRGVYEQLRRPHPDGASPDDMGPRGKPSRSATRLDTGHSRNPSREITLLENGLIVEHVDLRREEKEERERRRKEEKRERERSRARKHSKSSGIDVMSMRSAPTQAYPDGFHTIAGGEGSGQMPSSRYSQSSSRPMSVFTMPLTPSPMRPNSRRLHSQISLASSHSISSASGNRGSKFFAFRNWSEAWKSRESFAPSGMSGSMMDMHVALDTEKYLPVPVPVDIGSASPSLHAQPWPSRSVSAEPTENPSKSKKKGLAKLWNIITGKNSHDSDSKRTRSVSQSADDDTPLAPPPPLSYLVSRSSGDRTIGSSRHFSTSSLQPSVSPNRSSVTTPQTAGSSVLLTPTSPQHPDLLLSAEPKGNEFYPSMLPSLEEDKQYAVPDNVYRNIHPAVSEPDMRLRVQESVSIPPVPSLPSSHSPTIGPATPRPLSILSLHKSLPPLPLDHATQNPFEIRPNSIYAMDGQNESDFDPQSLITPSPSFRKEEMRRQSLGGLATRPSMPPAGTMPNGSYYDEFGTSRHSLAERDRGRSPDMRPTTPSKRKSKFGLSSILGRKSLHERESSVPEAVAFPQYEPEGWPNENGNGVEYGRASNANTLSPRMSIASRKAVASLVDQDPNFLAYRYPSGDQAGGFTR